MVSMIRYSDREGLYKTHIFGSLAILARSPSATWLTISAKSDTTWSNHNRNGRDRYDSNFQIVDNSILVAIYSDSTDIGQLESVMYGISQNIRIHSESIRIFF